MKRIIAPIAAPIFLLISCGEKSKSDSDSSTETKTGNIQTSASADGTMEANSHAEKVSARINAGLSSYYRIGESKLDLYDTVGNTRRGVMSLPVITTADLYYPTEIQLGDAQILDLWKKKDTSETVTFLLNGTRSPDGRWDWRDEIEQDIVIRNDAKPLSAFSGSLVKDSPEHLEMIKAVAEQDEKAAEEAATLDAAVRAKKISPITDLLKPGKTAKGMVSGKFFQLTVESADPSGTEWKLTSRTYETDTKLYPRVSQVFLAYDPEKKEVVVKALNEHPNGFRMGILDATVVVKNGALFFEGERTETVQGFKFE